MSEPKKFFFYENNYIIYRTKTAMCIGASYFNKGYQTSPALMMQFANVNDEGEDQKTFDWDTENSWTFSSYDGIFGFYMALSKWKAVIGMVKDMRKKESSVDPSEVFTNKYKDFADKNKFNNPVKKRVLYMIPRFYKDVYYLGITFNAKITVAISEDELAGMIEYVGGLVKNYHMIYLTHRMMNVMIRGSNGKGQDDDDSGSTGGYKSKSGGKKPSGKTKDDDPPFDTGGGSKGSFDDAISDIMGGLDDNVIDI